MAPLRAHKIILGACSMFFRNILASLPQTPCHLYIDGVSYEDLRNALRFMYLGEVQVEKDNLDFFMSACKKLELLGLSEDNIESFNDELEGGENKISTDIVKNEEEPAENLQEITFKSKDEAPDSFDTDNTKDNYITKDFKPVRVIKNGKSVFECGTCDFTSSGKHHLKYHIDSKHLNIRYPCGICDYSSQQPSDLKKHQQLKHEKIRPFSCAACPYKAFDRSGLTKHASSKRCPIKEGGRIEKKIQSHHQDISDQN